MEQPFETPPPTIDPADGLLAVGVATEDNALLATLARRLTLEFGPIVARLSIPTGIAESGREWMAFGEPIAPGRLAALRQHANGIERLMTGVDHSSAVRLDVVWIDRHRVLRALSGDAPHRIPLGHGIYAELVAVATPAASGAGDRFQPAPWSPADDAQPDMQHFFSQVADLLLTQPPITSPD